jgi:hypothetical protein
MLIGRYVNCVNVAIVGGADHENDDEGAAFCCAASGQGAA